jgi:hypothetical protein
MDGIARCQIVVCKDFIVNSLERIVWEDSSGLILVHSKDQYDASLTGHPHLEPVGFPIDDVFLVKSGGGWPRSGHLRMIGCPMSRF